MRTLLVFLLLLHLSASAQKEMQFRVDLESMGSGFRALATCRKTPDSFFLSSRPMNGLPFRLLHADSVRVKGDSVWGQMRVLSYLMSFRGQVREDQVNIQLISSRTGNPIGQVIRLSEAAPLPDYAQLARQIIDSTERYIFNPAYLRNEQWSGFRKRLVDGAAGVQDDLEMMLLFYMNNRSLPFTHYEVTKMSDAQLTAAISPSRDGEQTASLEFPRPGTALLRIRDFNGDGSRIDSLMRVVLQQKAAHLIIDLRGNTGGGAGAAMELVKFLSSDSRPAGAIVTRRWFDNHTAPPTSAQYSQLTAFSKGNTSFLIRSIPYINGFYLQIRPEKKLFKGPVFLLTDGRTASTCEPVVYGLQYFKRATVVGSKTAGAVLSKIPLRMPEGFVLFAPMADYFTIDGQRLDKVGVRPDVETEPEKALEKALELIGQ